MHYFILHVEILNFVISVYIFKCRHSSHGSAVNRKLPTFLDLYRCLDHSSGQKNGGVPLVKQLATSVKLMKLQFSRIISGSLRRADWFLAIPNL
jgi:hypothetical protein